MDGSRRYPANIPFSFEEKDVKLIQGGGFDGKQ
jgi:hypothetical protein